MRDARSVDDIGAVLDAMVGKKAVNAGMHLPLLLFCSNLSSFSVYFHSHTDSQKLTGGPANFEHAFGGHPTLYLPPKIGTHCMCNTIRRIVLRGNEEVGQSGFNGVESGTQTLFILLASDNRK